MDAYKLTMEQIAQYGRYLCAEERSPATVEKYLRDIRTFVRWLDDRPVTKEALTGWKEHLLAERPRPLHRERGPVRPQRPVPIPGLGGLPRQIPQNTAQAVPGSLQGTDPARIMSG